MEERDSETASDGYAAAVGLLAEVAWHGLERSVREVHLARWRGLARTRPPALCAFHRSRPSSSSSKAARCYGPSDCTTGPIFGALARSSRHRGPTRRDPRRLDHATTPKDPEFGK